MHTQGIILRFADTWDTAQNAEIHFSVGTAA